MNWVACSRGGTRCRVAHNSATTRIMHDVILSFRQWCLIVLEWDDNYRYLGFYPKVGIVAAGYHESEASAVPIPLLDPIRGPHGGVADSWRPHGTLSVLIATTVSGCGSKLLFHNTNPISCHTRRSTYVTKVWTLRLSFRFHFPRANIIGTKKPIMFVLIDSSRYLQCATTIRTIQPSISRK